MKTMKLLFFSVCVAATTFIFNSCIDDDGYSLDKAWYSIATICTINDTDSYSLRLDNGTTLWPVATDIPWFIPKENQRALVVYTLLSDKFEGYDHVVKIYNIQNILTKPIADNLGEENDIKFGTDPVNILDMWVGDNYLNVVFEFNYGGYAVHYINLVESNNTPYSFEFRHNAHKDNEYRRARGIVAFNLSSLDTKNEEVELTIKVKTFDGNKNYIIKYDSSKKQPVKNKQHSIGELVKVE